MSRSIRMELPSLAKEGWLRPLRKSGEAAVAGADGHERSECERDRAKQGRMVGSSHRLSEVERTTPAAPSKEWDHLLDGAATPPLPRRGLRLSRRLSQTPVSSGRLVGNAEAPPQGGVAASSKKIWRSHRSRSSRGGFPLGFIGKPPRPRDKRMLRDIF